MFFSASFLVMCGNGKSNSTKAPTTWNNGPGVERLSFCPAQKAMRDDGGAKKATLTVYWSGKHSQSQNLVVVKLRPDWDLLVSMYEQGKQIYQIVVKRSR